MTEEQSNNLLETSSANGNIKQEDVAEKIKITEVNKPIINETTPDKEEGEIKE